VCAFLCVLATLCAVFNPWLAVDVLLDQEETRACQRMLPHKVLGGVLPWSGRYCVATAWCFPLRRRIILLFVLVCIAFQTELGELSWNCALRRTC
jgi:hypothetical protein